MNQGRSRPKYSRGENQVWKETLRKRREGCWRVRAREKFWTKFRKM